MFQLLDIRRTVDQSVNVLTHAFFAAFILAYWLAFSETESLATQATADS